MSLTAEQFAASNKASIETLLELSQKAFAGVEKIVELNLQAAKASLEESAEHTKALLSAKDAQEVLALQASLLQPTSEKLVSYSRQLYDIASSTQAEVAKVAEAQFAGAQEKFTTLVDGALKNAPAGSENAAALVRSALSASSNAYESMQKAAKQAAGVAEANFQAITQTAANAATTAAQAAPKPRRAAAV